MDNITHTLAGALIGQMGLKRRSRFAMAACLLGANAPDIDVFAPLIMPVEGIAFHRGPTHAIFGWPILAAAIVAILWLVNRIWPGKSDTLPFRAGALFVVTFLAVLTHPFLDWLTTYAIAIFSPASWRWYSGNAIFIIDWVYWLLMIPAVIWSGRRWKVGAAKPGQPAQIAGLLMLAYIGLNLAESMWVENRTRDALRGRGIEATIIVPSPPPFAFWRRSIAWRSADRFGYGEFDFRHGLRIDTESMPLGLDDPRLEQALKRDPHLRGFYSWSRMPIVVVDRGRAYLGDQRYNGRGFGRSHFLVPLDSPSSRE
ncbi:MAG: metal-dependent hydrolase [Sphingomicrobium sp.]